MKCPAQFKYKYIDRIKKRDESIEAFMGKLVHKTLEYLHNQRLVEGIVSYDNLITYYSRMWDELWHNRVAIVNKRILPIDRENKNLPRWKKFSGFYFRIGEKVLKNSHLVREIFKRYSHSKGHSMPSEKSIKHLIEAIGSGKTKKYELSKNIKIEIDNFMIKCI